MHLMKEKEKKEKQQQQQKPPKNKKQSQVRRKLKCLLNMGPKCPFPFLGWLAASAKSGWVVI